MNQISTIAYVSIDVNPNGTVTMDTYTRSASDPSGFYDIRALAAAFVGFFVMEYQLKLQSGGSAVSPLTNTMFSDSTAVDQHLAAVPGSKVLLGLPYFGIDWPTTGGTLTAQATGPATPLSYGQIVSSDHPVYWNPTTDTAWTSYELGAQRHETFFEDPTSLYDRGSAGHRDRLGWARHLDARHGRKRLEHVVGVPWILAGGKGWSAGSRGHISVSTGGVHHQHLVHDHHRYFVDRLLHRRLRRRTVDHLLRLGHDHASGHCSEHHLHYND